MRLKHEVLQNERVTGSPCHESELFCRGRFGGGLWFANLRGWRVFRDVFQVRFNPVTRDLMLSSFKVDFPRADQIEQPVLESVLQMRVPGGVLYD